MERLSVHGNAFSLLHKLYNACLSSPSCSIYLKYVETKSFVCGRLLVSWVTEHAVMMGAKLKHRFTLQYQPICDQTVMAGLVGVILNF